MKKYRNIFLSYLPVIFSLFFTACPSYVTLNTAQLINGTGTISGTIRISEDSSCANKTAFPVLATKYYYKIIASYSDNGTPNSRSYELGELPDSNGNMTFSLNLPLGEYTSFTAEAYSSSSYDSNGTVLPVLSGTLGTKTLSEENPFISNLDFVLRPGTAATGSISLTISVTADSTIDKISIQDLSSSGAFTADANKSLTNNSYSLTKSGVTSGAHPVSFSFHKGTELLYQCQEIINVYDGMETSTWVQNGSAEHITDNGSGTIVFKVTLDMVKRFAQTNIYVDPYYTGTTESGTYFSPYKNLQSAITKASGATYPDDTTTPISIHVKNGYSLDLNNNLEVESSHPIIIETYKDSVGDKLGSSYVDCKEFQLVVKSNLTVYGFRFTTTLDNCTKSKVLINGGGVLNLYSTSVDQNKAFQGISLSGESASKKAVLNMYTGAYVQCCGTEATVTGDDFCGIYAAQYAEITMNDNSFVSLCGGGVPAAPSDPLISVPFAQGGGIILNATSRLIINDSAYIDSCGGENAAAGAVRVNDGCTMEMNGGRITGCIGTQSGVYIKNGTVTITGGYLKGNQKYYNSKYEALDIAESGLDSTVTLKKSGSKGISIGFTKVFVHVEGEISPYYDETNKITYPVCVFTTNNTANQYIQGTTGDVIVNSKKALVSDSKYYVATTGYIKLIDSNADIYAAPFPESKPEYGCFKIETVENLNKLQTWCTGSGNQYSNVIFVLGNDIDYENAEWKPVGGYLIPFSGTFDGKGHTIKNLKLQSKQLTGFFGLISDATIMNLTITGESTVAPTESDTLNQAGVFTGGAKGTCVIDNCVSNMKITASKQQVGGFVGYVGEGGNLTIRNCINKSQMNCSGASAVGGFIGNGDDKDTASNILIENCANMAAITASSYYGGFIGNAQKTDVKIYNCIDHSSGISGNSTGGLFIGGGSKAPVMFWCYTNGNVSYYVGNAVSSTNIWVAGSSNYSKIKYSWMSASSVYYLSDATFSHATRYLIDALNTWVTSTDSAVVATRTSNVTYKNWKNTSQTISFE